MRKRSRYRPRPVYVNPVAYVLEGMTPVSQHGQYLIGLKIKNHDALTSLTKGVAKQLEIEILISCANICEALCRMGFGDEYADVVTQGQDALHAIGRRGAQSNRFILKSHEMSALNSMMDLHDAQMDIITVKDMELAVGIVKKEFEQKKMRPIIEKEGKA